ncbi:MAG: family 78 glycoside hydrolase catalytic domain [Verrucomicrobia bacterium]|nr:family 78 glycoside hydrolase catalytic domain [Verrucomicrobiota bacterium]
MNAIHLLCEALNNPLGIDAQPPALSWIVTADGRDQVQTAYRILGASTPGKLAANEGDLWDSGKVVSDQTLHVPYAGRALASGEFCHCKVMVWDGYDSPSGWSEPAFWSMGLLEPEDWKGKWISDEHALQPCALPPGPKVVHKGRGAWEWSPGKRGEERESIHEPSRTAPWLRKSFTLDQAPRRAIVTIAAVGYHELYVNGRKAGDDILSPAVSKLDSRVLYVTRDITDLLQKGENTLGLWLGQGWTPWSFYGLRHGAAARGQLVIETDGQPPLTIVTDETWKTHPSPITFIGSWIFQDFGGELFDARLDNPDWCSPKFDDSAWKAASVIPVGSVTLSAENAQPNRITASFPAVAVEAFAGNWWSRSGYRIDMGRTYTGWLRLRLNGRPGQLVTLAYSDHEDGTQVGEQYDEVILDANGCADFCNRFNYRSFRWVFVSGIDVPPSLEDATGCMVHTDFSEVTTFSCSNELIVRIFDTMAATLRALTQGACVVDCPHRERGGYGSEGGGTAEFGLTRFDLQATLNKWLRDWRDVQHEDGWLPSNAPHQWGDGGMLWGLRAMMLAWWHYSYYGDRRMLAGQFPTIRKFFSYLDTQTDSDSILVFQPDGNPFKMLGDWATAIPGTDTGYDSVTKIRDGSMPVPVRERELFVNCEWIFALRISARIAELLDRREEAEAFRKRADALRQAVHARFYDHEGGFYVREEQPYLVMPLVAGLPPDEATRRRVLENLERNIVVTHKGHNVGGCPGSYHLFKFLTAEGRGDLIHTMLTRTDYPSWGHMLDQGATTFWEFWSGGDSRIHGSYTQITWFVDGLAGIKPDTAHPGFKHFVIKPAIVGDLTWVRCAYDSARGKIISNWKLENGRLTMEITVPANTTATIHIQTPAPGSVEESGSPVAVGEGIHKVEIRADDVVIETGAGTYVFTAMAPGPQVCDERTTPP